MPNWCSNQVTVTGNEDQLIVLMLAAKSESCDFSFANLYPCPQALLDAPAGSDEIYYAIAYGDLSSLAQYSWIPAEVKGDREALMSFVSSHYGHGIEKGQEIADLVKSNLETYGFSNWYDWCVANWGTKWDVEGGKDFVTVSSDGLSASLRFDSAWVPPTAWYAKIAAQGFNVTAYYWEPGCNFCGMWQNESDNCFEIAGNSDWVEANIPHELNEAMGISETMSEWEQDNEDGNESTTEETV